MLSRVALLLPLVLSAQAKDLTFWDPATSLTKGENIKVTKKAGCAIHGQLINATADAISVQTKKAELTIPRPEIATVGTKLKASNTGKIVGAAIGAVGGFAAGAALGIGWGIQGYKAIYKGQ